MHQRGTGRLRVADHGWLVGIPALGDMLERLHPKMDLEHLE